MRLNQLPLIAFAAAFLIPFASADDDGDDATMNVCISPQSCFQNNADSTITFCITSPWNIHFPKDLRNNIAHTESITPVSYSDITFDRCGWNVGSTTIYAKSVSRGTIYYKPDNASLEFRPPRFPVDVAPAVQAMKQTYPLTEIMLILLFCVILPIGCPILYCVSAALGECLKKRRDAWQRSADIRRANRASRQTEKPHRFLTTLRRGGSKSGSSAPSSNGDYWDAQEKV